MGKEPDKAEENAWESGRKSATSASEGGKIGFWGVLASFLAPVNSDKERDSRASSGNAVFPGSLETTATVKPLVSKAVDYDDGAETSPTLESETSKGEVEAGFQNSFPNPANASASPNRERGPEDALDDIIAPSLKSGNRNPTIEYIKSEKPKNPFLVDTPGRLTFSRADGRATDSEPPAPSTFHEFREKRVNILVPGNRKEISEQTSEAIGGRLLDFKVANRNNGTISKAGADTLFARDVNAKEAKDFQQHAQTGVRNSQQQPVLDLEKIEPLMKSGPVNPSLPEPGDSPRNSGQPEIATRIEAMQTLSPESGKVVSIGVTEGNKEFRAVIRQTTEGFEVKIRAPEHSAARSENFALQTIARAIAHAFRENNVPLRQLEAGREQSANLNSGDLKFNGGGTFRDEDKPGRRAKERTRRMLFIMEA